jgi:phage tail-like protein
MTKKLLDYLPDIYDDADDRQHPSFLGQYLRVFERVLFGVSGSGDDANTDIGPGLEEEVARIPLLLDPKETDDKFLPWLANWVALSFHPDLSEPRRRRLLEKIVRLYRIRGTRRYIEDLLSICVDAFVTVTENEIEELQVEDHSTVGVDTYVGGGPPHFFSVRLVAPNLTEEQKESQVGIAHMMLALAKPAHTSYELGLFAPRMQIGNHSTVGVNTVLSAS